MKNKEGYTGIDVFRVIAALFVVAIHTSPLLSVNETADFVLTRAICRVAVPFFFMISGFALFQERPADGKQVRRFVLNTLKLYVISIIIYIPLNWYTGLFRERPLAAVLLKDVIFDGTVYHLWYFPAAIIGAAIVYLLYRKAGFKATFAITILLYVIGLLGDSYYGFAVQSDILRTVLDYGFNAFDYTRNGIFFTPLFLLLGGMVGGKIGMMKQAEVMKQPGAAESHFVRDLVGFLVFFALMIAEALVLHRFGVQRHDSMYVMLAPCMYFLFLLLTHFKGNRLPHLRGLSMIVYIIHPMVIAAVLPAARLTGLTSILVDNSPVHYIAVCAGSVVFALVWMRLWQAIRSRK
ncbi:MAG: acyltransferase family protein [Clostridiales Family XIII bacterium]|jgi:serine/alanine racemase|nr:acyltransferase family protein [Clostridiales Family XIII bacterium]